MNYSDKEMDASISTMLRTGVMLAAALVAAGGALYLRQSSSSIPDYAHLPIEPRMVWSVHEVVQGVVRLNASSVIQFGLLVLVATPVLRVIYCVVGFARQRDGLYVAISCGVLAVLLYSLMMGGR